MRNIRNSDNEIEGYLLTIQRRLLLNLVHNASGHIDAKELYRRANSQDESISLATVYRSLHLFKDLGLVEERLAACVSIVPKIKSIYIWEDKLQKEDEILLIIKSKLKWIFKRI